MKADIHPVMHKDAKTTCSTCGTVYLIPSTVKDQSVEICRNCHPVYTGKKQTEVRGGRVERFRKIQAAARGKAESKNKK
jgi:ribosomal protein L31